MMWWIETVRVEASTRSVDILLFFLLGGGRFYVEITDIDTRFHKELLDVRSLLR